MTNKNNSSIEQKLVEPDPYKEREILIKEREIELKELELKNKLEIDRRNRWSGSPLWLGLTGFIFATIGSVATSSYQGYSNVQLERQKFEFSAILKAFEGKDKNILIGSDKQSVMKNLQFLGDIGIIKTLDLSEIEKTMKNPDKAPNFSSEDSKSSKYRFFCEMSGDNIPTTAIRIGNSSRMLIRWKKTYASDKELAFKRCLSVSKILQESFLEGNSGNSMYLATGKMNGSNVICLVNSSGSSCKIELFKLSSEEEAKSALKYLLELDLDSTVQNSLNQ